MKIRRKINGRHKSDTTVAPGSPVGKSYLLTERYYLFFLKSVGVWLGAEGGRETAVAKVLLFVFGRSKMSAFPFCSINN